MATETVVHKKIVMKAPQVISIKVENASASDDATATAADILDGKTAYVNGLKVTGTLKQTSALEHDKWVGILNGTLKDVLVPESVTRLRSYLFYDYRNITHITLNHVTYIGDYAFAGCTSLSSTSLSSELEEICSYAFMNTGFKEIHIPAKTKAVHVCAFRNCRYLNTATFLGTPETIGNNCFQACTNLKTINVPWKEGAVAGAPWGATNAVINYEVTT